MDRALIWHIEKVAKGDFLGTCFLELWDLRFTASLNKPTTKLPKNRLKAVGIPKIKPRTRKSI